MFRTGEELKKLAAVAGVMLLSVGEALSQERTRPSRRLVVSIPDRKLAVVADGKVMKVYVTAVGAARTPSPTGTFTVVARIPEPTWYTRGRVVPPGPGNPLGTRWLGLSTKGYGIHGTNAPKSIGRNASHGCIRMRNRDIEELFEMVEAGDVVELYGERTAELDRIFGEPSLVAKLEPAAGGQ